MQVKNVTVGQLAGVGALVGSLIPLFVAVKWIDDRYMNAIEAGDKGVEIFHIESEIIELRGTASMYEARLQFDGSLDEVSRNRYQLITDKLRAHTEAVRLLQQELSALE